MRRLHYLDNVRILLSILVVLHHVGIGYGTMGNWCYLSTDTMHGFLPRLLSGLFGIEATFSMSLFFFISAYLTPYSYDKKGAGAFLKRQGLRLGVPLIFVIVLFGPSLLYFIEVYRQTTQLTWFSYLLRQNVHAPTTSHAWFLLVLLLFEGMMVFYWKYIKPRFSLSALVPDKMPSHFRVALLMLLIGGATLLIRHFFPIGTTYFGLQFANFVYYMAMYALGIVVSRRNGLDSFIDKYAKVWFLVAIPFAALFAYLVNRVMVHPPLMANFVHGIHGESATLVIMETTICFGFSAFLLRIFRERMNFTNVVLTKMAETRYGVYIVHSALVVGVTIMLEFLPMAGYLKFGIASVLSVVFSFLVGWLLRKIRFVGKIL